MQNTKKQNGITLIALVITIVIMLILAGVSVTVTLNGGLINTTGKAKEQTEMTNERERISYALYGALSDDNGRLIKETVTGWLNEEFGENNIILYSWPDETMNIIVKESGREYIINSDGEITKVNTDKCEDKNPGELAGAGTEDNPYIIESIEDLVYFEQQVNSGNKIKANYVELGTDLDFRSISSYENYSAVVDEETGLTIMEKLNTGNGFVPIAKYNGTFDGKGYTIYNIYEDYDDGSAVGLFAGGNTKTIKNLTLTGEIIGNGSAAGISGAGGGTIINCNNYVNVTGNQRVAGFGGGLSSVASYNIINCNNYGKITGNEYLAGINSGYGPITDCNNYGEIIGENYIAGISVSHGKVENCVNYGKIEGNQYVGGINGHGGPIIILCKNYGEIVGEDGVGGITGVSNVRGILDSINYGKISGNEKVGGISGWLGNGGFVQRCYNVGYVCGETQVGGIVGFSWRGSYIKCAYNKGEVSADNKVGGILGELGSTNADRGCSFVYNVGKVTGTTYVGSVVGQFGSQPLHNSYYFANNNIKGAGDKTEDITDVLEGKDEEYLKSQEFVDILNSEHTHYVDETDVDYTGNCWVLGTEELNEGYPVFKSNQN